MWSLGSASESLGSEDLVVGRAAHKGCVTGKAVAAACFQLDGKDEKRSTRQRPAQPWRSGWAGGGNQSPPGGLVGRRFECLSSCDIRVTAVGIPSKHQGGEWSCGQGTPSFQPGGESQGRSAWCRREQGGCAACAHGGPHASPSHLPLCKWARNALGAGCCYWADDPVQMARR